MAESIQHKLDRVRPPRVQITYDLELGGAVQRKSLPLVVGIMADLSGNPETPLPPLKKRKFVEIDRDNINEVMAKAGTRLQLSVPNRLTGEGNLPLELSFGSMDDFGPLSIVQQVEALRALYEQRQRLSDLLTKLDGNDELEAQLSGASEDELKEIRQLSAGAPAEA
jgi:type VI secretion system ImpB/VipA family protein